MRMERLTKAILSVPCTIEKYQPRISLSAYHRSEDLYELPLLLRDMCADVRLGMRHHPYVPAWETNFYVTFG